MKKFIPFITGFMCAALLFSTTPIKAATDYINAYFNNNQKLTVNGAEKQIRFLNASNTNYGSVRDIVNAMGGNIDYIDATDTIAVTTATAATTPAVTPSPSPSTSTNINNTEVTKMSITTTPDGITKIDEFEGKSYIGFTHIQNKLSEKGYELSFNTAKEQWELKKDNEIILSNIPFKNIYGRDSFEYNYYVNTILPLIK